MLKKLVLIVENLGRTSYQTRKGGGCLFEMGKSETNISSQQMAIGQSHLWAIFDLDNFIKYKASNIRDTSLSVQAM